MSRVLGREQLKSLAVEANTVQMILIWVFILLSSAGREIHAATRFIDIFNLLNDPVALRDLVLKLSGFAVKIQMIPAISFGTPQNLARGFYEPIECLARIHIWVRLLAYQNPLLSGGSVNHTKFLRLVSAFVVVVIEALAVRKPLKPGPFLKRQLDRGGLHIGPPARLNIEDDGLRLGQHLTRQWIDVGECLRPELVRRNELHAGEAARISG